MANQNPWPYPLVGDVVHYYEARIPGPGEVFEPCYRGPLVALVASVPPDNDPDNRSAFMLRVYQEHQVASVLIASATWEPNPQQRLMSQPVDIASAFWCYQDAPR